MSQFFFGGVSLAGSDKGHTVVSPFGVSVSFWKAWVEKGCLPPHTGGMDRGEGFELAVGCPPATMEGWMEGKVWVGCGGVCPPMSET